MKLLLLDRPIDAEIIKSREVEYFGPWAQPINIPEDLSRPVFEPYLTPESMFVTNLKIISESERILKSLTYLLNDITGLRKSERFWKAYLAGCIVIVVTTIEDIKARHRALPEKNYIVGLPSNLKITTPSSWNETTKTLLYDDYFNWLAMTAFFKNIFEEESVAYERVSFRRITDKYKELCKMIVRPKRNNVIDRGLALCFSNYLLRRKEKKYTNTRFLVWEDYNLDGFDFSKFKNAALFDSFLFNNKPLPLFKKDDARRVVIKNSLPHPYGEVLSTILPLEALEGLPHLINFIERKRYLSFFRQTERIYTHGQAFGSFGLSRLLFALIAETGKKIVSIQHGGNYLTNSFMYLDRLIADEYISWGEGYSDYNIIPKINNNKSLPSIYLTGLKGKSVTKNKKTNWDVLLLVLEEFRYVKWFYNPLFCDLAYDYYERQKKLFDNFCVNKRVGVKVYPDIFGWKQIDWIKSSYPKSSLLISGRFVNYALKSKIVVIDYSSTGFLEMLVINQPFLATWNRRWFKGGKLFEDFIDRLIQVGIFYEQPEMLIRAYRELVLLDINLWWVDAKRQEVIREMARNFALTSDGSYKLWEEEFQGNGLS